jgi:hypothetical protein
MAQLLVIDRTTPYPDGSFGDDAFTAFGKINDNFAALQKAADMSGVSVANNQALYWNGTTWVAYTISAAARAMLAASDAAGIRTSINAVGNGNNETIAGAKTFSGATLFTGSLTQRTGTVGLVEIQTPGGNPGIVGRNGDPADINNQYRHDIQFGAGHVLMRVGVAKGALAGAGGWRMDNHFYPLQANVMDLGTDAFPWKRTFVNEIVMKGDATAKAATLTSLGAASTTALTSEVTARADADTALSARMIGRNQLINGDFRFAQRGSNFAVAASGRYGLDRWFMSGTGSQIGSAQMSTGGTGIPNTLQSRPKNAMQVTVNSVAGANNNALMVQRIEDVSTLAGGKATFSGWVWGNVTTTISVGLYQSFGTTGASAIVKVNAQKINVVANQWNYVTLTFDIPHVVGKTITANNCLWLNLWLDAGANYDGAGDAGGIGQKSGTYWFTQLQLEAGANATPFEFRRDAVELTLCQRYYEKSPDIDVLPSAANYFGRFCIGMSSVTGSQIFVGVPFKTTKRNTPSIAVWSSTNTPTVGMIGQDDGSTTPAAVANIGMNGYQVSWSNTAGRWGGFFQWAADSEL